MTNDVFDATTVQPAQGGMAHPAGLFEFGITNTYAKANKGNTGGMLVVEMTSPAGRIENRYNLWNQSPQAVEIAQKELSALCHAVNIYKITFPKDPSGNPIPDRAGFELRGGRGRMEVTPQLDREGKPNGYMEVKKVFDINGNEPGKTGSAPQPQPAQSQPMQTQPNGAWATPNAQPQPNPNPAPQGWGGGQPAQPQQQANPTPPWGAPKQ